ncbi:MAG: hypothetical protein GY716_00605 [bacterium]|nr:hypothetical protein [bacterium]
MVLVLKAGLLLAGSSALAQDIVPPAEVQDLRLEWSGNDILLSWDAVTSDLVGAPESAPRYRVYSSTSPSFVPDRDALSNLLGGSTTNGFTHAGGFGDGLTHYYLVSAVDEAQNEGNTRPSRVSAPVLTSAGYQSGAGEFSWTDSQPSVELGGYSVFWGDQPQGYTRVLDAGQSTSAQAGPMPGGANYYSVFAYDLEGNFSSGTGEEVVETAGSSPPDIMATISPPPNAAGWNNTDVTVTFSCSGGVFLFGPNSDSGTFSDAPLAYDGDEGTFAEGVFQGSTATTASHEFGFAPNTLSGTPRAVVSVNELIGPGQIRLQYTLDDGGLWTDFGTTGSHTALELIGPHLDGVDMSVFKIRAIAEYLDPGAVGTARVHEVGFDSDPFDICPDPVVLTGEGAGQVVNGNITDPAGNSATITLTIHIDKTPPTLMTSQAPPPNAAGWNNTDVTVSYTCDDGLSGVGVCPGPVLVDAEGTNIVNSGASDLAGNSASSEVTILLDKTPPTGTAEASLPPPQGIWYTGSVLVLWDCDDDRSGVESCPLPRVVSTQGADQLISGDIVDVAGNTGSAGTTLNIDSSPPIIFATVDPPPVVGWNNTDVTVTFTCDDPHSGIASCPAPVVLTEEGTGQLVEGTAQNNANWLAHASAWVNIDKTPPNLETMLRPPPGNLGWNDELVTVDYRCAAALCPVGPAGLLQTGLNDDEDPEEEFSWYRAFGPVSLATNDKLTIRFALIPFDNGSTSVSMDEVGGRTGYPLVFSAGLVNGLVPYQPGHWNVVEATWDFSTAQYNVAVNGVDSGQQPFLYSDSTDVLALRVHWGNSSTPSIAFLDELAVTKESWLDTFLYADDFSGLASYPLSAGTIHSIVPPAFAQSPVCAPCPDNQAVRLDSEYDDEEEEDIFQLFRYFGHTEPLGTDSVLNLHFALIPFDAGDTYVGLNAGSGGSAYSLLFANGTVNGAVPYVAGQWNVVDANWDFSNETYTITVNGNTSAPLPFDVPGVDDVRSLSMHLFSAPGPAAAFLDGVHVTEYVAGVPNYLFVEPFTGTSPIYNSDGTISRIDSTPGLNDPLACFGCTSQLSGEFYTEYIEDEGHEFGWFENFGDYYLDPQSVLRVRVVIIPFADGQTYIAARDTVLGDAYRLQFDGTLINDVAPYDPTRWSVVEGAWDFATGTYTITVNGDVTGPLPFETPGADSVKVLRFLSLGAQSATIAYVDSLAIVEDDGQRETLLYAVNFDKQRPTAGDGHIGYDNTPIPQHHPWGCGPVGSLCTENECFTGPLCPFDGQITALRELVQNELYGSSADQAGNSTVEGVRVDIDTQDPTITADATPPPNANGWNASIVTVTFTCDDPDSGVATCSIPRFVTGEGAAQEIAGTVTDNAGNEATDSVSVSLDLTDPQITLTVVPAPNPAGWNNSAVTVQILCTDTVSDIDSCTPDVPLAGEGADQIVPGTAVDLAGHTALDTVSVSIDLTDPTVSIDSPADGTIQDVPDVTLAVTAADSNLLASVTCNGVPAAPAGGDSFTCDLTLAEGPNVIDVVATDVADNQAVDSIGVTYDPGPPSVTITSPAEDTVTQADATTVGGIYEGGVSSITINGVAATLDAGTFSAVVSLIEGTNILVATAESFSGATASDSISVRRDTAPPVVVIETPQHDDRLVVDSVAIAGAVNDIIPGATINADDVTVTLSHIEAGVSGIPAAVNNMTFFVDAALPSDPDPKLILLEGTNTIEARAEDVAGNVGTHTIQVSYEPDLAGVQLMILGGNAQSAPIYSTLQPLNVVLQDSSGTLLTNRVVEFEVNNGDGLLGDPALNSQSLAVLTDAQGEAQSGFTLGSRTGMGFHRVRVTTPGSLTFVEFCATALNTPPTNIAINIPPPPRGVVDQPLGGPVSVIVTDDGGNPVPDVEVLFTVDAGGGSVTDASAMTNLDGVAETEWTMGLTPGTANNEVSATFVGNPGLAAVFVASGIETAAIPDTKISGIVQNSAGEPIEGARAIVRETNPEIATLTGADGHFVLTGVPPGGHHVLVQGSNASDPPNDIYFPDIEFAVEAVAGVDNALDPPVITLPFLNKGGEQLAGGSAEVNLQMAGVPGFAIKIFPYSTYVRDPQTGDLVQQPVMMSSSQVKFDKVPMPPPQGSTPLIVGTLQPGGVLLNPPAQVTYPNVEGLAPGDVADMFAFHHDIGQFVNIGPATISDDGRVAVSDPGFGIVQAGWHCLLRMPGPTGLCEGCEVQCTDRGSVTGDVSASNPSPGNSCESGFFTAVGMDTGGLQEIICPTGSQSIPIDPVDSGLLLYSWTITPPEGQEISGIGTSTPEIALNKEGTYTAEFKVVTPRACAPMPQPTTIGSATSTVPPFVEIAITDMNPSAAVLCPGCQMTFEAEADPCRSVLWSIDDPTGAASLSDASGDTTTLTIDPGVSMSGNVTVRATDSADPEAYDERSILVFVPPASEPRFNHFLFGTVSPTERDFIWDNFGEAWKVRDTSTQALRTIKSVWGMTVPCLQEHSVGNAVYHAFGNCYSSNKIGTALTKDLFDAHEQYTGNTCVGSSMDWHNNEIGRQLSGDGVNCVSAVLGALQNGQLRWTNYDPNPQIPLPPCAAFQSQIPSGSLCDVFAFD